MPGREPNRWKMNLQLLTMLVTIQTIHKKKQSRHQTTNQRTNNHRNRLENKRKKLQKDFLRALVPEATHQTTPFEYRTEPDRIKIDKIFALFNRHYLPKRTNTTLEEIPSAQNNQTNKHSREKLIELEKNQLFGC